MKKQKFAKFGKTKSNSTKSLNAVLASALGLSVMFTTPAVTSLAYSMPSVRAYQEESRVTAPTNFSYGNLANSTNNNVVKSSKNANSVESGALNSGATGTVTGGSESAVTGSTGTATDTGATVVGAGLKDESVLPVANLGGDFWGKDLFYVYDDVVAGQNPNFPYKVKTMAQLVALSYEEGNFYQKTDVEGNDTEAKGTGTEADPYIISTPLQLAFLGAIMTARGNSANNPTADFKLTESYFALSADIDFAGKDLVPLANVYYTNNGGYVYLNGNGHKILNAYVDGTKLYATTNMDFQFTSIFGSWQNGTIENVVIENANIVGSKKANIVAAGNNSPTLTNFKDITITNSRVVASHIVSSVCDKAKEIVNCKIVNTEVLANIDEEKNADGQMTFYTANATRYINGIGISNTICFEEQYVKVNYANVIAGETYYAFVNGNYIKIDEPSNEDIATYYIRTTEYTKVSYKNVISGETYYQFKDGSFSKVATPVDAEIETYFVKNIAVETSKVNFSTTTLDNYTNVINSLTNTIIISGVGKSRVNTMPVNITNISVNNSDIGTKFTVKDQTDYTKSSDATIVATKKYFVKNGSNYTQVTGGELTGSPRDNGWYETAMDNNFENYNAHFKTVSQNVYTTGVYYLEGNFGADIIEFDNIKVENSDVYANVIYAPTSQNSENIVFSSLTRVTGALYSTVSNANGDYADRFKNITIDGCNLTSKTDFNYIANQFVYTLSTDTKVDAQKRYFIKNGNTYTEVTGSALTGNPSAQGWYTDRYIAPTAEAQIAGAIMHGNYTANVYTNINVQNCNLTAESVFDGVEDSDIYMAVRSRIGGIAHQSEAYHHKFVNCSFTNNKVLSRSYADSKINTTGAFKGATISSNIASIGNGSFENCSVTNNDYGIISYNEGYKNDPNNKRVMTGGTDARITGLGGTSGRSPAAIGAGAKNCTFENNKISTQVNTNADFNQSTYIYMLVNVSESTVRDVESLETVSVTDCKIKDVTLDVEYSYNLLISGLLTQNGMKAFDTGYAVSNCEVENIDADINTDNFAVSGTPIISYGVTISGGRAHRLEVVSSDANHETASISFKNINTKFVGRGVYYSTATYFTASTANSQEMVGDVLVEDVRAENINLSVDTKTTNYSTRIAGIAFSAISGNTVTKENYAKNCVVKNCEIKNSTIDVASENAVYVSGVSFNEGMQYESAYNLDGQKSSFIVDGCRADNLKINTAPVFGVDVDNPEATSVAGKIGGFNYVAGINHEYSPVAVMQNCKITNSELFALTLSSASYVAGLGYFRGNGVVLGQLEANNNKMENTKAVSYGAYSTYNGTIYRNDTSVASAYINTVHKINVTNTTSENSSIIASTAGSGSYATGILYNSTSAAERLAEVFDSYSVNNQVYANYRSGASNGGGLGAIACGIGTNYVKTMQNCVSSGSVLAQSDTGMTAAYGIGIGFRPGDLNSANARPTGAVHSQAYTTISDCYNFADVSALGAGNTTSHAGGIGYSDHFDSCINYGTVTGNTAGGIMSGVYTADANATMPLIITNCTNAGDVVRSSTGAGTFLGGLVGRYYNYYRGATTYVYDANDNLVDTTYDYLDTTKLVLENNTVTGEIFTGVNADGNYITEYALDSYIGTLYGQLYVYGNNAVYNNKNGTISLVSAAKALNADDYIKNTVGFRQMVNAYSIKNNYVLINDDTNAIFNTINDSYTDNAVVDYEYQKSIPGYIFTKYGTFSGVNEQNGTYLTNYSNSSDNGYNKDIYNNNSISYSFKLFADKVFSFDGETPSDSNHTVTALGDANFALSQAATNYNGYTEFKQFKLENGTAPQVATDLKKQIIYFDTNGVDAVMSQIVLSDVVSGQLTFDVPKVENYNKIGYTIDGWMKTATGTSIDFGALATGQNMAANAETNGVGNKVVTLFAHKDVATIVISNLNNVYLNDGTNPSFAYGSATDADMLRIDYTGGGAPSGVTWKIKRVDSDQYDNLMFANAASTKFGETNTYQYKLLELMNSNSNFFENYATFDQANNQYTLVFDVAFDSLKVYAVNVSYSSESGVNSSNYTFSATSQSASVMTSEQSGYVTAGSTLSLDVTTKTHYQFNQYNVSFVQEFATSGVSFYTLSGENYVSVASPQLDEFKNGNYYVNIGSVSGENSKFVQIPQTNSNSSNVITQITTARFPLNVENRSYNIDVNVEKVKYDINISFQNLQGAVISTATDSSFVKGNFVDEGTIGQMSIDEELSQIQANTNIDGYRFVGWKLGNMGENEYLSSADGKILEGQKLSANDFGKYIVNDEFYIIAIFQRQFDVSVALTNPVSSDYASLYTITYVDENGETVSLTGGELSENETNFSQIHRIDQNTLVEIAVEPNKKVKLANIETGSNIRYSGNFAYFYLTGNTDINFVFETKPLDVETSVLVVTDPTSFEGTTERNLASAIDYGVKNPDGSIDFSVSTIPVDGSSRLALSSISDYLNNAEYRCVGMYLYNYKTGEYDLYDTENTVLVDGDEFYDSYVTNEGSILVVMKAIKQYSARVASSGLVVSDSVKNVNLGTYTVNVLDENDNVIAYIDTNGNLTPAMVAGQPNEQFNRMRIKTDIDTGVDTILFDSGLKLKVDAKVLSKYADFVDTDGVFSEVDTNGNTSATILIDGSSNRSVTFGFDKTTYTISYSYNAEVGGEMKCTESFKLGDKIMISYTPKGNYSVTDWKIGGKTLEDLGAVLEGNTITITATEEFMNTMLNMASIVDDGMNVNSAIQTTISPTLLYGMIGGGAAIVILFGAVLFLILRSKKLKKQKEENEKKLNDMCRKFGISDMIKDLKAGNTGLPNSPGMAKSAASAGASSTSSASQASAPSVNTNIPDIKTPTTTPTNNVNAPPASGGIPGFNTSVQDAINRANNNGVDKQSD